MWPHLPFLTGRGPSKMLVGEPPQTRLFGTKCPKEVGCVTAAIAAVPYRSARPSVRADGQCCGLPLRKKRGGTMKSAAPNFGTFCPKDTANKCVGPLVLPVNFALLNQLKNLRPFVRGKLVFVIVANRQQRDFHRVCIFQNVSRIAFVQVVNI